MTTTYTKDDVAKHNTAKDLWISIHGEVYDVTSYAEDHPGGVSSLVEVAGQDATAIFEDLGHSAHAREVMQKFVIGKLDHEEDEPPIRVERHLSPITSSPPAQTFGLTSKTWLRATISIGMALTAVILLKKYSNQPTLTHGHPFSPPLLPMGLRWVSSAAISSFGVKQVISKVLPSKRQSKRPAHFKVINNVAVPKSHDRAVLDPHHSIELPVSSIERLSSNSNKIIIDLPKSEDILGLPVGQHIAISADVKGTLVKRSYTPTSSNKDKGRLELVIKNYDDGVLTGGYLKHLRIGDKVSISGPRGQMRYRRGLAKNIGMIAGGTGITPMYQLIRAICEDPKDNTNVTLIYANQTQKDILLKDELDKFMQENGRQFKVHYVLSRPTAEWQGGVGRCNQDLVSQLIAPGSDRENKAMLCGPDGMVEQAKEWLTNIGYEEARALSTMRDQVFCF